VPEPLVCGFNLVQKNAVMEPRQLSSSLLDNCFVGPSRRESPHIQQVSAREALHVWKGRPKILRQPVYHLASPALIVLSNEDLPPDVPVEENQFLVNRERRANLGLLDAIFDVGQQGRVGGCVGRRHGRSFRHYRFPPAWMPQQSSTSSRLTARPA